MDEGKINEKRINYRAITIVLVSIIAIYFLFHIIKFPLPQDKVSTELKPFVVLDYYTAQEKVANDSSCVSRNFSYSYSWEGWDSGEEDFTTPYLKITNDENQSGIYMVQFAFFDANKYPYVLYKDKIKWEDAAMYSEEKKVMLEPGVSSMVSIPTKKPTKTTSYWAIGDIKVPVLFDCGNTIQYKTVVKNKTVTEYKNIEKRETVLKKISIWDYLFGKH